LDLSRGFQCPDIDWDNLTVGTGAAQRDVQQALVDYSIEQGITQLHRECTREENILDLVFTNNATLAKTSTSIPGISDHNIVVTDFDIMPQITTRKHRKCYLFSRADWEATKAECAVISANMITAVNDATDVDHIWDILKSGITKTMDKNIPSKILKGRISLPWSSYKLRRMVRRKSKLYKSAKQTGKWDQFRSFQRKCKVEFKRAEVNYINNTIEKGLAENNTKPFCRFVKSRRQENVGVPPLKQHGRLINDSTE
jgi:hypothetical protein